MTPSALELPSPLEPWDAFVARLDGRLPALFLDYDGTLTPIVPHPPDAILSPGMREALVALAGRFPLAIVSGRDRADVEGLLDQPGLIVAGSHGFDIKGPGIAHQHEAGVAALPELDAAEAALRPGIEAIEGAALERKKYAIALHFRNAPPEAEARIAEMVSQQVAEGTGLRKTGGKKIFEVRPDIEWHKGKAVDWLFEAMGLNEDEFIPVYFGDDETDEDAFEALAGRGLGVLVGPEPRPTAADFALADPEQAEGFFRRMLEHWPA